MQKAAELQINFRNDIPRKGRLLTEIGSQMEYLLLDISSTIGRRIY